MERLALSWGKCVRQFTKLLLSLLSHIAKWLAAWPYWSRAELKEPAFTLEP